MIQVANKKQRDTAAADAEMRAKRERQAAGEEGDKAKEETDSADILGAGEDEDVIF